MTHPGPVGSILIGNVAAAVEVRNLTLGLCSDKLNRERQAYSAPSLVGQIHIRLRNTLVPHTLARGKCIFNRSVEIILVHQEVVNLRIIVVILEHNRMSIYCYRIIGIHSTISSAGLRICRLS